MKTKRKNDDERAAGQERHVLLRQGMQYWWRRILPWSSCSLFALFIVASAGFAQEVPTNSETSQATKSQTVPGPGGPVTMPGPGGPVTMPGPGGPVTMPGPGGLVTVPGPGGLVTVPSPGERIYTDQDVGLYPHAPSPLWGNLFNKPIHGTTKGGWFEVTGTHEYPSLSGNQIWLRVKPFGQRQDKCQTAAHGCWVYLGKRPTTDENPTWNFKSGEIRVMAR